MERILKRGKKIRTHLEEKKSRRQGKKVISTQFKRSRVTSEGKELVRQPIWLKHPLLLEKAAKREQQSRGGKGKEERWKERRMINPPRKAGDGKTRGTRGDYF